MRGVFPKEGKKKKEEAGTAKKHGNILKHTQCFTSTVQYAAPGMRRIHIYILCRRKKHKFFSLLSS